MKLRNKKTGEIKPAEAMEDGIYLYNKITKQWYKYELDLLAECWEYYEEPKEIWYIDWQGNIRSADIGNEWEREKEIGNYFETKEEAERAVEKLKAFKRLKDRRFGFYGYQFHDILSGVLNIKAEFENDSDNQIVEDLDLLFGGEE